MKMQSLMFILLLFSLSANAQSILGAWHTGTDGTQTVRIYTEGFFAVTVYSTDKFIATYGGSYRIKNSVLTEKIEFDTQTPARIGSEQTSAMSFSAQGELTIGKQKNDTFKRVDDGKPGQLAGAWLITGRFNEGTMSKITPGARRTMKILSGTRFQWIAYNIDTKEFFGTGGGTYTTENGQYTETIDFFSRDQTRVGMSLTFNFELTPAGDWRHTGKSSKGDAIDEVWSKREKLGL
jgi:hypothetical protein